MPKFSKTFTLPGISADQSFTKITAEIERWKKAQESLMGNIALAQDSAKKEMSLESKFVNATLTCTDGAVTIAGDLSFFALPFKGKVEAGIEKWVHSSFPGAQIESKDA